MKAAVAVLALCALLAGTAPRAVADDDAETAPGRAGGAHGGPAPHAGGSEKGPAASSAPGGGPTQLGAPDDEDAPSSPDADAHARDPYDTDPSEDGGNAEGEGSALAAPEEPGARAHDPYAADPYDTDPYDVDGDQ